MNREQARSRFPVSLFTPFVYHQGGAGAARLIVRLTSAASRREHHGQSDEGLRSADL